VEEEKGQTQLVGTMAERLRCFPQFVWIFGAMVRLVKAACFGKSSVLSNRHSLIRRGINFFQHAPLLSVAFWILLEPSGPFVVASCLASSGVLAPLVGLEQVSLIFLLWKFDKIIILKKRRRSFFNAAGWAFNTPCFVFCNFF
jgi:hypothetical protein